jgi:signal transduction histidine kinase
MADEIAAKQAIIEVADRLPKIWVNPLMLKTILIHLIRNALQYVARGVTPSIEISVETDHQGHKICIKDNGVGIQKDQQEKIFNIFERLSAAQRYPGTGIGLAIVRKGVERMGGRVWANSEPGKGSCFCVVLPNFVENETGSWEPPKRSEFELEAIPG